MGLREQSCLLEGCKLALKLEEITFFLTSTNRNPFFFFDEKVDQSRNDESSPDVTIANASRAPPP